MDFGFKKVLKGTMYFVFLAFAGGILDAALGGFCNSCWVVCRNTSITLWQKIADLYIITAAKSELTDMSFVVATMVTFSFAMFGPFHVWRTKRRVDKLTEELTCGFKKKAHDKKEEAKRIAKLKRKLPIFSRILRVDFAIMLPAAIVLLYSMTLQGFAYKALKEFRLEIDRVRPNISESQLQHFRQEWVMMETWKDYRGLKEKMQPLLKQVRPQRGVDR